MEDREHATLVSCTRPRGRACGTGTGRAPRGPARHVHGLSPPPATAGRPLLRPPQPPSDEPCWTQAKPPPPRPVHAGGGWTPGTCPPTVAGAAPPTDVQVPGPGTGPLLLPVHVSRLPWKRPLRMKPMKLRPRQTRWPSVPRRRLHGEEEGAGHRDACGAGRRAGAEAGQGHEAARQDAPAASRGGRGLPGTSPRPSRGARPAGARGPSREPAAAATRKLPTFVSLRQPWELTRAHTRACTHTRARAHAHPAPRPGLLQGPLSLSTRFQPTASQNPMTMTVSQTQAARTTQQHH